MPYGLNPSFQAQRDDERRQPRWWEQQQQARPAAFEPMPPPPPQQDPIATGMQQALMAGLLNRKLAQKPTDPNAPQSSPALPANQPGQAPSLLEMFRAAPPASWPGMMFGGGQGGMGQGWNFMPPGFTRR